MCNKREIKVHRSKGLLFMFSPPKINQTLKEIKKNICILALTVFYLTQPSNKQIICFDFEKQNSALPNNILHTLINIILDKLYFFSVQKGFKRVKVINFLKWKRCFLLVPLIWRKC